MPKAVTGLIRFVLQVPADAVVKVNGRVTQTTGTVRSFVARGLQAGTPYRFDFEVNGQARSVTAYAGQNQSLSFGSYKTLPRPSY